MKQQTIKKLTLLGVSAAMSLILCFPNSSLAHELEITHQLKVEQDKRGEFKGKQFKKMAKYLQLSSAQRKQMKNIRGSIMKERAALQSSMKTFKGQVKTLVMADVFDEQAFAVLHQEHQPMLAKRALIKAKMRHKMLSILNEEQKSKWVETREKRRRSHLFN